MGEKFSRQVIENNISEIRKKIAEEAEKVNRDPAKIKLLAATKTVDADTINFAISKGIRLIGENRVQELLEKYDKIDKSDVDIHFIGRLQTNKVKYIIDKVSLIHSVDSLRLAEEIDKQAKKHDLVMDVLLEVYGLLEQIAKLTNVRVKGLMTIPPKCNNLVTEENGGSSSEKVYKNSEFFDKILNLFLDISSKKLDNICMYELSAGMSDDYITAVRYGATILRLGRAIFGDR